VSLCDHIHSMIIIIIISSIILLNVFVFTPYVDVWWSKRKQSRGQLMYASQKKCIRVVAQKRSKQME